MGKTTKNKKYRLRLVTKESIKTIPITTSTPDDIEIEAAEIDNTLFFFVPDQLISGKYKENFIQFIQDVGDETGKKCCIIPNCFDIAKCELEAV
jgi:hypothetical protein